MKRLFRFIKRYRWRCAIAAVVLPVLAVNALAFMHARAMTRFVSGPAARTRPPEGLSVLAKATVLLTGVRLPRPANAVTPGDLGIAFETHRIPLNATEWLEAWRVPCLQPARGTVVLFHSYGAAKASLLPSARLFRAMNYDVVLVDFRGGGGSSGGDTTIGYREADDVAAAVLRAVGVNGVTADALVLESPFDRLLSTVDHRFEAMGLPAFPMSRLLVMWGGLQNGYWAFGHNPADYARGVRCPTLLLHGEHDPRVTTAEARRVADALAGPKSLELFPNAGHLALAEAAPERWTRTVGAFLTGVTDRLEQRASWRNEIYRVCEAASGRLRLRMPEHPLH